MFVPSDHDESLQKLQDSELWALFREGNRSAFSVLFLRYYNPLYNYGFKFYKREEDVKDGIQKLFFRLWKDREKLDQAHYVYAYLLHSLRRILLRKKNKLEALHDRNDQYAQMKSYNSGNIEQKIIKKEIRHEQQILFRRAFDSLTDRQKEALILRLDHGLKNKEIAQVMNLTHQRVRNLISQGTKRLKHQVFEISH